MEDFRIAVDAWFFWIKAVHVMSVALWSFSTSVAWVFYLKPAFLAAHRRPDDARAQARRDDFMERFDSGASLEHVAFVLLVVTALLMIWLREVNVFAWNFIALKFWIGVAVILPMEAVDIYLSHLGGNKRRARAAGDVERHHVLMVWHWRFFRVTEPLVVVLIPLMFILAIVKPF